MHLIEIIVIAQSGHCTGGISSLRQDFAPVALPEQSSLVYGLWQKSIQATHDIRFTLLASYSLEQIGSVPGSNVAYIVDVTSSCRREKPACCSTGSAIDRSDGIFARDKEQMPPAQASPEEGALSVDANE